MSIQVQRGLSPIGGIIAWIKSFTGVPALATQGRDEWVEVDGQVINDVESPLNGQTLPDINGTSDTTRKFLRGSTTSGTSTSTATHQHCIYRYQTLCFGNNYYQTANYTNSESHIPPSYTVVWILRIK